MWSRGIREEGTTREEINEKYKDVQLRFSEYYKQAYDDTICNDCYIAELEMDDED